MTAEKPIPSQQRGPWNKGRMIGQKRPLKPKDVWTIRVRLQLGRSTASCRSVAISCAVLPHRRSCLPRTE
jgi:hypothetical protein